MAGALSYQHMVIPLNLTLLINQANSLEGIIQFYDDRICDTYDNASVYQPPRTARETMPTSTDWLTQWIWLDSTTSQIRTVRTWSHSDLGFEIWRSYSKMWMQPPKKMLAKLTVINGASKTLKNKINDFSSVPWEIAKYVVNVINIVSFSSLST